MHPDPYASAALLAAVLARPRDDGPRLAYADWVRDHGLDELSDFVQWQVARPRVTARRWNNAGGWDVEYDEARDVPTGVREWFREYSAQVVNGWPAGWRWVWRRGFVAELRLPADAAVEHLELVRRAWPVTRVTVTGEPGAENRRVLENRWRGSTIWTGGASWRWNFWQRQLYRMFDGRVRFKFETYPQLGGDVTADEETLRDEMERFHNGLRSYLAGAARGRPA